MVAALLAATAAGCGGGSGDKAGGSNAPDEVRLAVAEDADQPDARFVRDFVARVARLSDGNLRVKVTWDAAGQDVADPEPRLARMVHDGSFDLGWISTRAWDLLGVSSFQALQAPFLATDHPLLGRIATGDIAERMLAGLDEEGYVGLALAPDRLRYAFGARHPLTTPEDFAGARLRVRPSHASDAMVRALGATPLHIPSDDLAEAVERKEVDGAEASLGTNSADEGESHVTANLPLYPRVMTLFAARDAYDELDDEDRDVLRQAADQTAAFAAAHPMSENALLRSFCKDGPGTAVTAADSDVAALERAAQPVYAQLERDAETRELIAAIRGLKDESPAAPATVPPPGCNQRPAAVTGRRLPASTLNGTYHWRVTAEGARAAGGDPDGEDVGTVGKMTLRDGRWRMGDIEPERYSGSFEIRARHLVFFWNGAVLAFVYERHQDGSLDLRAIPPMDTGDAVVWTGGRWQRVGPPVREIPGG